MHRKIAILVVLFSATLAHARMGDDYTCTYTKSERERNHRPWTGEGAITLTDPPSSAVGTGVTGPVLRQFISPVYPKDQSHYYGPVLATVIVDTDGTVLKAMMGGPSSYDFPSAVQAARDAIMRWTFQPGEFMGKPIRTHILIEILFDADTRTTGACIE